ncbi:3'-5' exonuclease [Paenibacillus sp. MMO-177]|uniref:3'-5' exonuclease n=1 Tax=Paenibacillus sp. MMO-177 TaxID=3081289 RepID=UPI003018BC92
MRILFTDSETGGLDPRRHSLLQLAVVSYEVGKGMIAADEFYVKNDHYELTEEAMKINQLDVLNEVHIKGLYDHEACDRIVSFIERSFGQIETKADRPILSGHNVGFDKSFMEYQLFDHYHTPMQKYISHRTLDIMSLLWGLHIAGKIPVEACTSQGAFEYFGVDNKKAHTALSDILASIEVFEKAMKLMKG